jgi:hypothetical protein
MKLLSIIACLLLAANVYAGQTEDTDGNDAQKAAPEAVPGWASADGEPASADDEGLEPSYSDTDEPSFGGDGEGE